MSIPVFRLLVEFELPAHLPHPECRAHAVLEMLEFERLLDVVECAELKGLNRRLHRGVCGHQDALGPQVHLLGGFDYVDTGSDLPLLHHRDHDNGIRPPVILVIITT